AHVRCDVGRAGRGRAPARPHDPPRCSPPRDDRIREGLKQLMSKTKPSEIIVGLDIGTTKIACIVGEVTEDGVDIIGIGTAPSKGLRRGYVVNIDATVASIQQAVDEAENMAGCEISQVYAAISGAHVRG